VAGVDIHIGCNGGQRLESVDHVLPGKRRQEESASMLGKLKEMFAPGGSGPGGGRRVNLEKRFSIVAETSRGSMSKVYRAMDNQTGRTVCLKVQSREKNEAATSRASSQQRRPSEGEMAIHLTHPHIVRTFDYGVSTRGEHFVVMEYVDGVSLQFVRETRSARPAERMELLAQAAEGLAALHAEGYIHHDINPRNFLMDRNQQVKLIDFGLTVPNTPAFCAPGNRTGTVQYMAPELLRREPIDERIDIFAFGVLAFEFLTERLPYDGTTSAALMLQRINTEPLDPAVVSPRLSEEVCALLRQLTAKRKDQRWAAMKTLPEAFRSIPVKRT
jgi:eukaryotic-like serine/threonine-protein kinase